MEDSDLYQFAEESNPTETISDDSWSILVVADDESVHTTTKLSLKDFLFENKKLSFFHAYSYDDAIKHLDSNINFAVVLIGIGTKDHKSDLNIVKYIRETKNNKFARIIIRAENLNSISKDLLDKFDFDRYKYDLSPELLQQMIHLALRTYCHLMSLVNDKNKFEKISLSANRFIPLNFLRLLNKADISDLQLADCVERDMNVLFLDIRSFTSLTEFLTPSETFQFVNDCMSYFEPNIIKNNGFVDKYIGDSIMALFATSADEAVRAAIEIFQSLEKYNMKRITQRQVPISIGIGVNTGSVIIGTIGFYDRIECTVISDAVNAASRIEKLNKLLGTQFLISETTYLNLKNPETFHCRYVGKHYIYGKKKHLTIYEVFDINDEDVVQLKLQTAELFDNAIKLFESGEYISAKHGFHKIIEINKYDSVAKYFLNRLNELLLLNE